MIDAAEKMMQRCHQLATISEMPGGILRQFLTPEHKKANQQVADWAAKAGLQSWQDAIGNQWIRLPAESPEAPRLILGSHLDTVPNAGAYDGILGVVMALQALEAFAKQKPLPFHLDVVGFADEEGTRFGTTLIGSHAIAGNFNSDWLSIEDRNGKTMREALVDFGLEPEKINDAAITNDSLLGYWEVHIEQGPVLEALAQPIGIVSGIAGAKRAAIRITGKAGHAGTTPMSMRQDAVTAAAELISFIEETANTSFEGEVATVGNLNVAPGATNVIAGFCELSLDVRALVDSDRDALILKIQNFADTMANARGVNIAFDWYHSAPAVPCDQGIQKIFKQAAGDVPVLRSGAGHDAMAVAEICPVGMLFIRSPNGLSHHPDEAVIEADVQIAFEVLVRAIKHQADAP